MNHELCYHSYTFQFTSKSILIWTYILLVIQYTKSVTYVYCTWAVHSENEWESSEEKMTNLNLSMSLSIKLYVHFNVQIKSIWNGSVTLWTSLGEISYCIGLRISDVNYRKGLNDANYVYINYIFIHKVNLTYMQLAIWWKYLYILYNFLQLYSSHADNKM